jgi:hypothetical protein
MRKGRSSGRRKQIHSATAALPLLEDDAVSRPHRPRPLDLGVHTEAMAGTAQDAKQGVADCQAAADPALLAAVGRVDDEVGARFGEAAGAVGGIVLTACRGVQCLPGDQVDGGVEGAGRRGGRDVDGAVQEAVRASSAASPRTPAATAGTVSRGAPPSAGAARTSRSRGSTSAVTRFPASVTTA